MVPPPVELKGSEESQLWQNYMVEKEGLARMPNRKHLLTWEALGFFVSLPQTNTARIDSRLKKDPEYCFALPRVADFLKDRAYELRRDLPGVHFEVSSAVRDEDRQKKIRRAGNWNAASVSGPKASSHLTGATIDITKKKMSKAQIEWWRKKLLYYETLRMIEATEEFNQAVFHIMVFGSYKRMHPDDPEDEVAKKVTKKKKGK